MATLVIEQNPVATEVEINSKALTIKLADGRSLTVPLSWYPRLQYANESERLNWQLLGGGYAIEWPDLDEHIGVEGLVAGRRSGESSQSFARWMASHRTPAE